MAIMQNNPPSVGNAAENTGITPYYPGREGPIGEAQVKEATGILNEYKRSKANLERRIVENEQWWKMRHWDLIRKASGSDPEPASAVQQYCKQTCRRNGQLSRAVHSSA